MGEMKWRKEVREGKRVGADEVDRDGVESVCAYCQS